MSSSQNDGLGFSPNLQSVHSHADVVPRVCSGYALAMVRIWFGCSKPFWCCDFRSPTLFGKGLAERYPSAVHSSSTNKGLLVCFCHSVSIQQLLLLCFTSSGSLEISVSFCNWEVKMTTSYEHVRFV